MERVLSIISRGNTGIAYQAQLAACHGRCEGMTHFGNVTMTPSRGDKQSSTQYFELPRDLAAAFASGRSIYLAPGVLVGTANVGSADYRMEGPGARMFQVSRRNLDGRSRAPQLPAAWLAAIRAAI